MLGAAEPLALITTLALLIVTPDASAAFWLIACAFVALLAMHAAYWLMTHPVNNFWLKDFKLKGMGARFFSLGAAGRTDESGEPDWTLLRNRWEFSHVVRAALGTASLTLLVTALAV